MASKVEIAVEKPKSSQFQLTQTMVRQLITCLKEYKNEMDFTNIDFNSDVVALYTEIRTAHHFECFGPTE